MMNLQILTVDVGTTGTRAALFNLSGTLTGLAYREYKSTFITPTTIEQDGETWLQAVDEVIPEVIAKTGTKASDVLSIAVTTQRATILPVDMDGRALAPAILWQDRRTTEQCKELVAAVGEETVYQRTGLRIDPYFSLPKLMWYRDCRPDVYSHARYFLTVHDFVIYHLTGVFRTETTQASRTMLLDVRSGSWDAEIAQAAGIDIDRLPEVGSPGSIVGRLKKAVAQQIGLPAGLPVVMCGGDQQCAAVGLGVIKPGVAKVTTGTGAFIVAPVREPRFDSERRILCSASAISGQWVFEAGVVTAGAVYRWLRDELGTDEIKTAKILGVNPYTLLDSIAARVNPGADGLIVLPHFTGSAAPYWNSEARGLVFNLTLSHTRGHMIRALLEGIAIEVQKNLQILCELAFPSGGISEVRVSGGASQSQLFNQIQADVFGCRIVPGQMEQASALGAAILASVAVSVYSDVTTACQSMVKLDTDRGTRPIPENEAIYQQLSRLHDATYRALERSGIYKLAAEVNNACQVAYRSSIGPNNL